MPETPKRKKEPENTKRGQVRELREERDGGSWGTFCRDSPRPGGQPAELLCRLTPNWTTAPGNKLAGLDPCSSWEGFVIIAQLAGPYPRTTTTSHRYGKLIHPWDRQSRLTLRPRGEMLVKKRARRESGPGDADGTHADLRLFWLRWAGTGGALNLSSQKEDCGNEASCRLRRRRRDSNRVRVSGRPIRSG